MITERIERVHRAHSSQYPGKITKVAENPPFTEWEYQLYKGDAAHPIFETNPATGQMERSLHPPELKTTIKDFAAVKPEIEASIREAVDEEIKDKQFPKAVNQRWDGVANFRNGEVQWSGYWDSSGRVTAYPVL